MHDYYYYKTRSFIWDIAKYKANILILLQKLEVRGQFPCSRAKTWGLLRRLLLRINLKT